MPAKLVLALCPNQTIEERGDFALLHGLCWRCLPRFGKEGVNLRKTIFTFCFFTEFENAFGCSVFAWFLRSNRFSCATDEASLF